VSPIEWVEAMMRTAQSAQQATTPGWRSGDTPERNLERVARTLEIHVPGMRGHSRRVAVYSALTAQRMGLDRVAVDRVRRAATIHDIGKSEVPAEVLNATGELEDEEFAAIQEHATAGARIVAALGDEELTAIVRHHHERFDGDGYPDGLRGGEIPIGARIIAVADTFDAVTSVRPYRPQMTQAQALELIVAESGAQFDPAVVSAFRVHCSGLRGVLMAVQRR
jgi:putative nucleotidyltransferase with HDIG domain